MRFLHTSDWHLGRQFHNVSLLEDQAYVLDQLVAIVAEQAVDAVVIAGDIYDRAVPPAQAVKLLDLTLDRLCREHALPVIVIPGNHDSPERLGFGARQLESSGLYIIDSLESLLSPVILHDTYGEVAFYGVPYLEPAIAREYFGQAFSGHDEVMAYVARCITEHRRREHTEARTVVVSHCFVTGGQACESERPLSIGGADQVSAEHFTGFNYTALGHLHRAQQSSQAHIRYSGSVLKYSFSEEHHRKSVTVVDMEAQGDCVVEEIALLPLHDMRTLEGPLEKLLELGKSDPGAADYLQVRLSDTHAILDIMAKLRAVYPNVLHVERPGLMVDGPDQSVSRDQLKRGELSMFEDFYRQVWDQPLDEEQRKLLHETIEQIHRGE